MKRTLATLFWVAGLSMAGSEGPYFSVNIVGALIFLASSTVLLTSINCGWEYHNMDFDRPLSLDHIKPVKAITHINS